MKEEEIDMELSVKPIVLCGEHICPKCDHIVRGYFRGMGTRAEECIWHDKYCSNCGVKLDWTGLEEDEE